MHDSYMQWIRKTSISSSGSGSSGVSELMQVGGWKLPVKPWILNSIDSNTINNFIELLTDPINVRNSMEADDTLTKMAIDRRDQEEAKHADEKTGLFCTMKEYKVKFPLGLFENMIYNMERLLVRQAQATTNAKRTTNKTRAMLKKMGIGQVGTWTRGEVLRLLGVEKYIFRGSCSEAAFGWAILFKNEQMTQKKKRLFAKFFVQVDSGETYIRELDNPIETRKRKDTHSEGAGGLQYAKAHGYEKRNSGNNKGKGKGKGKGRGKGKGKGEGYGSDNRQPSQGGESYSYDQPQGNTVLRTPQRQNLSQKMQGGWVSAVNNVNTKDKLFPMIGHAIAREARLKWPVRHVVILHTKLRIRLPYIQLQDRNTGRDGLLCLIWTKWKL